MKKQLFRIVWLFVISMHSNAQVTTTSNVPAAGTDYVGWNNTATIPLRIKNDANYDMEFYTNSTQRMTLKNTGELGLGTTSPSSWFHILTNSSGTVDAKEVFRTEVATNTESNW